MSLYQGLSEAISAYCWEGVLRWFRMPEATFSNASLHVERERRFLRGSLQPVRRSVVLDLPSAPSLELCLSDGL